MVASALASVPPASAYWLLGNTPFEREAAYAALLESPLPAGEQARIEATTDRRLDEDVVDIDTQRTGGLLELSIADGSKIVVNRHVAAREIWVAAKAGGFHFRHDGGRWLGTRDGAEFFAELSRLASAQAGRAVSLA